MELVRSVCLDDIDELWELVGKSTYGLTTLQITKEQLSERVELSNFAFTRKTEKPSGEPYVFVMEETKNGKLVGLSCIFSKTGGYQPFYSYQLVSETHFCEHLGRTQMVETLQLAKIHDGPTEIGSLFLSSDYRGQGRGRLLSLSRFMFMASHPKRFAESVIAEMRGVMTDEGECPFWEAIGRHFFDMDFPQADILSTVDKRFIESFMPKYPIYVNLLPDSARAIMGDVHPHTRPALAMLEAEGFKKTSMVDIFDGGPVVECATHQIDAVKRTRPTRVAEISAEFEGEPVILSTAKGGFRAMLGEATESESGLIISERVAPLLQVRVGDPISALSLHPA